mmetsp:Transcript_62000/g.85538  ORF Transcript_62000/g.85538 Transcript_62000/m.85538 type:complete len:95 (+) Transcript_62000:228-512(+)|eukprot:scaffold135357_cov30-Tisochrysis_lutea.AAC.3
MAPRKSTHKNINIMRLQETEIEAKTKSNGGAWSALARRKSVGAPRSRHQTAKRCPILNAHMCPKPSSAFRSAGLGCLVGAMPHDSIHASNVRAR